MAQKPRTPRAITLPVTAAIEPDADGHLPNGDVAAYAFSEGGHVLHFAPLDKSGAAGLKLALPAERSGVRVLIGPLLELPDLTELLRRGAHEIHVVLDPREVLPIKVVIDPDAWLCWFRSRCSARGTVLKRTLHDGEPLDLPVCGAEVEIYEVDPIPIVIARLPDHVIVHIREELLRPSPIPIPDPPEPLAFAARLGSLPQLRRQLVLNPAITRLILCQIRPAFVTKTLIGTATTDQCGHFRHRFFVGCNNHDQPDLYFRVLQPQYGGGRVVISEPTPVPCHTYWDYACGTEVTIYTTSPYAQTCTPCPPLDPGSHHNYVAVMHVGNLLTSNIYGVSTASPAGVRGQATPGRPFGGTLNPHLEFDPQLAALGVTHYRVTVQSPGGGNPRELDTECFRHYRYAVPGGAVVEPYKLGPVAPVGGVSNLFKIPPSVPPQGVWSTPSPYEDQANAKWNSTVEAPGVADSALDRSGTFELKIELFDDTGALVTAGVDWLVPQETSVAGASVLHLVPPAPGIVQGSAFVLPLHVDNNACRAAVDAPLLGTSAAADQCGVMRYGATSETVTLPYYASHRNGFATYDFNVQRGVQPLTPPTVTDQAAAGAESPTESVLDLLSGCTIGAFLEALRVKATATDGWSTLSGYDASASRAFALAPTP